MEYGRQEAEERELAKKETLGFLSPPFSQKPYTKKKLIPPSSYDYSRTGSFLLYSKTNSPDH